MFNMGKKKKIQPLPDISSVLRGRIKKSIEKRQMQLSNLKIRRNRRTPNVNKNSGPRRQSGSSRRHFSISPQNTTLNETINLSLDENRSSRLLKTSTPIQRCSQQNMSNHPITESRKISPSINNNSLEVIDLIDDCDINMANQSQEECNWYIDSEPNIIDLSTDNIQQNGIMREEVKVKSPGINLSSGKHDQEVDPEIEIICDYKKELMFNDSSKKVTNIQETNNCEVEIINLDQTVSRSINEVIKNNKAREEIKLLEVVSPTNLKTKKRNKPKKKSKSPLLKQKYKQKAVFKNLKSGSGSKTSLHKGQKSGCEKVDGSSPFCSEESRGHNGPPLTPNAKFATVGNNIYTDVPSALPLKGLRPIIIDGNNVAYCHTNHPHFSCKRLQICINYFKKKGHKVTAFVPQFRMKYCYNDDPKLLSILEKQGDVVLTPSRHVDGRTIVPYDDRFIVQAAVIQGGVIVSLDNYRDLLNENSAWADTIKYRLLQFTWLDDVIMFPNDPLGKDGPTLDEFLQF